MGASAVAGDVMLAVVVLMLVVMVVVAAGVRGAVVVGEAGEDVVTTASVLVVFVPADGLVAARAGVVTVDVLTALLLKSPIRHSCFRARPPRLGEQYERMFGSARR